VTGVVSDPTDRMTLLMKKKDVHGLVSGEHALLSPRRVKTNKVLRMPARQEPHRVIRMGEPLRYAPGFTHAETFLKKEKVGQFSTTVKGSNLDDR
jgi:hypothetical protein